MKTQQKELCALCGRKQKLSVDHDHVSGEVRGLLCNRCNRRLAGIDDQEWLRAALIYIGAGIEVEEI